MTIYQLVCLIRIEHFHNLRSESEKQFVEDMYDGLVGVPGNINDEDITEYLSPRQIEWIKDIGVSLDISKDET